MSPRKEKDTAVHRPKVLLPGTVLDAARKRIAWIFDEFDNDVTVASSGGKDSAVTFELAYEQSQARGTTLRVMWLDQECEYAATRNYQRSIADRPGVDFQWWQVPFKLFNATNHNDEWLRCWDPDPDIEWTREKEVDSIHDHDFHRPDGSKVDRFSELLRRIHMHNGGAVLTGMRSEESPMRRLAMTTRPCHKWATWSNAGKPDDGFTFFYPVYDWSYRDVWKAIEDHGWSYNTYYDQQARWGLPAKDMRVSNYHHETALQALTYLQEAEPETWERATRRLAGLNAYSKLGASDQVPKEVPYMFSGWEEYMRHLIQNLYDSDEHRETFTKLFEDTVRRVHDAPREEVARMIASCVIGNDLYGTRVQMWTLTHNNPAANDPRWADRRAEADRFAAMAAVPDEQQTTNEAETMEAFV